jgi:subtilisin family serine protease
MLMVEAEVGQPDRHTDGGAWARSLVGLTGLMTRTSGSPRISIGLLDGPVAFTHPDLAEAVVRDVGRPVAGTRGTPPSAACQHGTFVAGILVARRGARAPAICPGCSLLMRPIFREAPATRVPPSATTEDVASAIVDVVRAGAHIVNLSAATAAPSIRVDRSLRDALDFAAANGAIVIAAAGNGWTLGGTSLTRHPWVIPVTACDRAGRPLPAATLGASIGSRGVAAPGDQIESLGADGGSRIGGGTSAAAAFVSGAAALVWSLRPDARGVDVRRAIVCGGRRGSVTPPVLDAAGALGQLHNQFELR